MDDLIIRLRKAAHIEPEELAELMEEAAAALEAVQWQPIETAPKDGREILASEYGYVEIAFWSGGVSKWIGPCDSFGDPVVMAPTHWMPLPAPPEGEE